MKRSLSDPRLYQIGALLSLLVIGVTRLGFGVPWPCMAAVMASALATQYICSRLCKLPAFDPKSAIITALSLCLLLRGSIWILALAAAFAIASKFLLRVGDRHVFNPANIAIALFVAGGSAWISPSQWGSALWFAFLFVCIGGLVVTRARRADVTLAFLLGYCGMLLGRALWLGDPLSIPLKQMQSGALLLFAFFMISDPKTTPDARAARIAFGIAVAALAFILQYKLYIPQGLIYSLALLSPLVIILNRLPFFGKAATS